MMLRYRLEYKRHNAAQTSKYIRSIAEPRGQKQITARARARKGPGDGGGERRRVGSGNMELGMGKKGGDEAAGDLITV